MAKGKFDGSQADQREDRKNADKFGMTVEQWNGSPGDAAADRMGQRAIDIAAHQKRGS